MLCEMARAPSKDPDARTTLHLPRQLMEKLRREAGRGKKLKLVMAAAVWWFMQVDRQVRDDAYDAVEPMLEQAEAERKEYLAGRSSAAQSKPKGSQQHKPASGGTR